MTQIQKMLIKVSHASNCLNQLLENDKNFYKTLKKLYTLYTNHCNIQYVNLLSSV